MPKGPMMQTPTCILREVNLRLKDKNTSPNFRFILSCLFILAQNAVARRKDFIELDQKFRNSGLAK